MEPRKVTLDVDGIEVDQSPSAIFERQTTSAGTDRLVLDVPEEMADLLARLCALLPPPFYVLYVLHTPRGEGEPGRYQSTELSLQQVEDFLGKYASYLVSDARFDIWVYSPGSKQTLVWDRHNRLFIEGQAALADVANVLISLGFAEGKLQPIGAHYHHYRPEFDATATELLSEFDWFRTPLRPEDEQRPPTGSTVH